MGLMPFLVCLHFAVLPFNIFEISLCFLCWLLNMFVQRITSYTFAFPLNYCNITCARVYGALKQFSICTTAAPVHLQTLERVSMCNMRESERDKERNTAKEVRIN